MSDKAKRGRPRSPQSHQAILESALSLLAEVGFGAMSIEAIAARAGVGKTAWFKKGRFWVTPAAQIRPSLPMVW